MKKLSEGFTNNVFLKVLSLAFGFLIGYGFLEVAYTEFCGNVKVVVVLEEVI